MISSRLRAPAAALTLVLALLVAGCGGGGGSKQFANPQAEALAYFPANAPFVALIKTDPNGAQIKQAISLFQRFPGSGLLLSQALSSIQKGGVSYQNDLKPLLGNDAAFGLLSPSGGGNHFAVALVTRDAGKLDSLITKRPSPPKQSGSYKGATLYTSSNGHTFLARRGPVVVLSDSIADLKVALNAHDGSHVAPSAITAALGTLPHDALVTGYGNIGSLLAGTRYAKARSVPWVAAIGSTASTLSVTATGVSIGFRVDTSKQALKDADVPIDTNTTAPLLAGPLPIRASIHNLTHTLAFGFATGGQIDPAGYQTFLANLDKIKIALGLDLRGDVLSQFTGDTIVNTDGSTFLVRSQPRNAAQLAVALPKLARILPAALQSSVPSAKVRKLGGSLYSLSGAGAKPIVFGISGTQFVAGNASASALKQFAIAPATAAAIKGAFAVDIPANRLVPLIEAAIARSGNTSIPPVILNGFLSPLQGIQLGFSAATGQLQGTLTLALK